MVIRKANMNDLAIVQRITSETISTVYPHYYPKGAVDFFLNHHRESNIVCDIEADRVYLCYDEAKNAVGTVTIVGNEINRLFVLPEYQRKGFGRALLGFAESVVFREYTSVNLHASLPAKAVYLKHGYRISDYHVGKMENGDFLCVDIMEKKLKSE